MVAGDAHIHQHFVVIVLDLQGLLKMRRCFIVATALVQRNPQAVFYYQIRWSHLERVLKQCKAVIPEMDLRVSKSSKNQQNHASYRSTERGRHASCSRDVC